MPTTSALELASTTITRLSENTRGQLDPIGWAALLLFLGGTFAFFFAVIATI